VEGFDKIRSWHDELKKDIESGAIRINLTGETKEEFNKLRSWHEDLKQDIESGAIKISVTDEAEKGFGKILSMYKDLKQNIESNPIKVNMPVTIEESPKMPFSQGMERIFSKFGNLSDLLKGLEANIRFEEFTSSFGQLNNELKQIQDILPSIARAMMGTGAMNRNVSFYYGQQVKQAQEGKEHEIYLLQLRLMYDLLNIYGGSMQGGGYVQKTGLYKLHEGEQVSRTTHDNSVNNFYIKSQDPRAVAQEIANLMKYKRVNLS